MFKLVDDEVKSIEEFMARYKVRHSVVSCGKRSFWIDGRDLDGRDDWVG